MFYAFEYFPGKPPKQINGFDVPSGRLIKFQDRTERRSYVKGRIHIEMVGRRMAAYLGMVNHD